MNQLRYGFMSAYRRLFTLAFLVNLIALATCIGLYAIKPGHFFNYSKAATATGANLLMTALMRHEHCINVLFRAVCLLPYRTPLYIRRHAAKIYCYGGLHSGCGVSAAFWYVLYSVLVVRDLHGTRAEVAVVSCTTGITLVALALIVVMAHPYIRTRWHNRWEVCHRYGAWTAILMVWAQTVAIAITDANDKGVSSGRVIVRTPTFWFLCVITICIAYPWMRMRKVKVEAEPLSTHAVRLHFNHCSLPYCVGSRLTDKPLKETHGFATIAYANGERGYSCLVSNGGDWTKKIIEKPPQELWIRGAPTLGVMRVATLFKPIVVVATGSGIGPCLSFISIRHDYPMRVLWSARFPEATYGSSIMRTVLAADKDAIIIDTRRTGHPNLLQLSWALVKESSAEAVIIISNPKVTRQVVYGLETRRVAAFGAVFDS
ncbi:hypothetical protein K431DRAFT_317679 [Polychaeton citri CBS 116435]|uniref:Integral membrane protein TmpA n=1 Tax=Polychaeton citri CBS 116435 TaxID=1314669 RepID=A0A9P4QEW4_9PEZI|nr:hypothetical protein K431DRAFT_317679 [Polychaeton citri CBS 116435]